MPEFINTIDLLGDDAVIDSIIDRTITEFKDDQITQVETRAFTSCKELQLVDLPSVTGTGFYAFQDCTSLKHVNLPLASRAHQYCFAGCTSLTEIVLPAAIDINNFAFSYCTNLEKVDVPKAKNIRASPFVNCSSLKGLILREQSQVCSLQSIGANSPIDSGTGWIYVPGSLINSYKSATNWSTYAEQFRGIIGDEEALQGIIDETLVDYENNEIESIPARAFYKYAPLKSVKSASVVNIGNDAFSGCTALEVVDFAQPVTIANAAFQFANAMKAIVLRNDEQISTTQPFALSSNYNIHNLHTCYFYVPRALIEDYKVATNWSTYAAQFRALEDYTVDGTTTGELDESKI